jgi:hypothetical protein
VRPREMEPRPSARVHGEAALACQWWRWQGVPDG